MKTEDIDLNFAEAFTLRTVVKQKKGDGVSANAKVWARLRELQLVNSDKYATAGGYAWVKANAQWVCDGCDRVGDEDTFINTDPSSYVGEATLCAMGHGCNVRDSRGEVTS